MTNPSLQIGNNNWAYKEDSLLGYAISPINSGFLPREMTFTRASSGTRINENGQVELVSWNLLDYSEQFDNAYWSKFNDSVIANVTTAPNGTTTADKEIPNTSNDIHGVIRNVGAFQGGIYTGNVYLKKAEYNFGWIRITSNSDAQKYAVVINLTTGAVTSTNSSGTPTNTSYVVEQLANDWIRLSISIGHNSGDVYLMFGSCPNGTPTFAATIPSFAGDGSSGAYIWGAQLNIGTTAKPYLATTDRLNIPRVTYSNGSGALLLEKQSTNIALYSEQFDNAGWSKSNVTITANNITSPDGTQDADLSTATAGGELLQGVVLSTSTSYTFSFYVKKGTANDAKYRVYNFDAGVNVVAPTSYISQTSTSDWVRVVVSFTTGATGTNYGIYLLDQTSVGTMYFWGAQLEASSYGTSYIPTTTTSSTRIADACYKTGISSWIGQTEGVLFFDADVTYTAGIQLGNSTSGGDYINSIQVAFGASSTNVNIFNGGTNQFSFAGATLTGRQKIAIAYKANDFALYRNGAQIQLDSSGTIPTMSAITINHQDLGTTGYQYNEIVLFKTRLTNAELASLTTL